MATQSYTTAGTFNHTTGTGVTTIRARVWGAGGGGGNFSGIGGVTAGAGAGGGAFSVTIDVPVSGGTTYTNGVRVGTGGGPQVAGGDSWFTIDGASPNNTSEGAMAKGGNGATTTTRGTGGASGSGIGDTRFSGGNGGEESGGTGGGGAGGAGTGGAGNDGSGQTGGAARTIGGGEGGDGGATLNDGQPGVAAGGAGGGAGSVSGTAGTGAAGRVDIVEGFEINVSESVTITEDHKEELHFFVNKSESVSVSESYLLNIVYGITATDNVVVGENRYSTTITNLSPTNYWRLGETSGTTAVDSAGSNNGTYEGSYTQGASSLIVDEPNPALILPGGNRQGRVKADATLSVDWTANWTVMMAVKPADNVTDFPPALMVVGDSAANGGILFIAQVNTGAIRATTWGSNNVNTANGVLAVGTTSHVVVAYTAATKAIRIFVNGVLQAGPTAITHAPSLTGDIYIGDWGATIGAAFPSWDTTWNGTIDDVAIFQSSFAAATVTAFYKLFAQSVGMTSVSNISKSESVSLTESHKEHLIHLPTVNDSINVTESHKEELIHYISEEENISVTDTPNIAQVHLVNTSDSIEVTENKAFTLVFNTSVSDSITVDDVVGVIKILLITVSDEVTITESLGFTVVNNINVSENLSSGQPPEPVPSQYILLTDGSLAVLVADISPYPLYQKL